jgi:hypothetical protein
MVRKWQLSEENIATYQQFILAGQFCDQTSPDCCLRNVCDATAMYRSEQTAINKTALMVNPVLNAVIGMFPETKTTGENE